MPSYTHNMAGDRIVICGVTSRYVYRALRSDHAVRSIWSIRRIVCRVAAVVITTLCCHRYFEALFSRLQRSLPLQPRALTALFFCANFVAAGAARNASRLLDRHSSGNSDVIATCDVTVTATALRTHATATLIVSL